MENIMCRKTLSIFLFIMLVQSLNCSDKINPANPNGYMRLLVRKLVFDEFMEKPGTYVFYWDGKNDSGKYVQDGLYRCVMTYVGYEREFFFNVQPGGKEGETMKPNLNTILIYRPNSLVYIQIHAKSKPEQMLNFH